MPIVNIAGRVLHLHRRVWLVLPQEGVSVDDVYAVGSAGGRLVEAWSRLEPMTAEDLLTWAIQDGLYQWEPMDKLIDPKANKKLADLMEETAALQASRLAAADGGLRGNLRPSVAQAATRAVLNGDEGLTFVLEPDREIEQLLATHPPFSTQTVCALSWRRPVQPRQWVVFGLDADVVEQGMAYAEAGFTDISNTVINSETT
jgi:hypothetical protein